MNLLNFQSPQGPMTSLLGQHYNPADMRRQMLSTAMLQAGIGLLGQGYSSTPKSLLGEIGTGLKAGLEGAQQGKQDYMDSAFDAYSLERQQNEDERRRLEDERKLAEENRREQERIQRKNALDSFYSQLDPTKRAFAEAFPEYAAKGVAEQYFPDPNADLDRRYKEAQIGALQQREPKAPAVQTFFDQKTGQEYKAQWDGQQWVPVGGTKAQTKNNGITIGPDGTVQIGGMPPMNVEQAKTAGFYNRASQVAPLLDKAEKALTDYTSAVGGKVPGVGNYLKSDNYRQAEQLGREFLAPILRKDTGAAVTPDELMTYGGIYLPAPGDDDATIAQKRAARQRAVESLKLGIPGDAILIMEMKNRQNGQQPGGLSGTTSTGVPWSIE